MSYSHPSFKAGRHFLQIPGPTNVPDRILRAIGRPTIDHRSKEFANLGRECLEGMKPIFNTASGEIFIFPASGTGAWEAAIVNTLSPGDHVLMIETGHFSALWRDLAQKFGIIVDYLPGDWRHGIDAQQVASRLSNDRNGTIKAVMCVHNETSTGVTSDIAAVRKAMDAQKHPALLMVDTVSSLASIDYRQDEWGVDVTIGGSQKGLMLPPGLGFNAVSPRHCLPRKGRACRALSGPGKTCRDQMQTATFHPRRPRISCTVCARPFRCFKRKDWNKYSNGICDLVKRHVVRCAAGVWNCSA